MQIKHFRQMLMQSRKEERQLVQDVLKVWAKCVHILQGPRAAWAEMVHVVVKCAGQNFVFAALKEYREGREAESFRGFVLPSAVQKKGVEASREYADKDEDHAGFGRWTSDSQSAIKGKGTSLLGSRELSGMSEADSQTQYADGGGRVAGWRACVGQRERGYVERCGHHGDAREKDFVQKRLVGIDNRDGVVLQKHDDVGKLWEAGRSDVNVHTQIALAKRLPTLAAGKVLSDFDYVSGMPVEGARYVDAELDELEREIMAHTERDFKRLAEMPVRVGGEKGRYGQRGWTEKFSLQCGEDKEKPCGSENGWEDESASDAGRELMTEFSTRGRQDSMRNEFDTLLRPTRSPDNTRAAGFQMDSRHCPPSPVSFFSYFDSSIHSYTSSSATPIASFPYEPSTFANGISNGVQKSNIYSNGTGKAPKIHHVANKESLGKSLFVGNSSGGLSGARRQQL